MLSRLRAAVYRRKAARAALHARQYRSRAHHPAYLHDTAAQAAYEVLAAGCEARARQYMAKAALEVEDTTPGSSFVMRWR